MSTSPEDQLIDLQGISQDISTEMGPDGFEPELPIDGEPSTQGGGNYDTLDRLRQEGNEGGTPGEGDKPVGEGNEPGGDPGEGDEPGGEPEELTLPEDNTDWSQRAKDNLGKYMSQFGMDASAVKTKDDYLQAMDTINMASNNLDNNKEVQSMLDVIEMKDEDILMYRLEAAYGLETEQELKARFEGFLSEDGNLSKRGLNIVNETKANLRAKVLKQIEEAKDSALVLAKDKTKFRDNTFTALREYKPESLKIEYNGNEVEIGDIKVPKTLKLKALEFMDTKLNSLPQEISSGEGYKNRVLVGLWANEETRTELIKAIAQEAYSKGRSDEIKKNVKS